MNPDRQQIVLVTGPAGAGRGTAIRVLEDLGYEAIDNLPLSVAPRVLQGPAMARPLALGIDARNRDFGTQPVLDLLYDLRGRTQFEVQLLYLDCSDEVLLRRYSETRRRHPLAEEDSPKEGIDRDKQLMGPIRSEADLVIDTTALSVHDLRAEIDHHFAPSDGRTLSVQVQSYSYKRGVPQGVDMALDVRFLRNPHWEPDLRPKDGSDPEVAAYVADDPRYAPFIAKLMDMLDLLLPAYLEEGKAHFTLGVGCTGGRHRSVAICRVVAKGLADRGWPVSLRHKELERIQAERKT